jgi:hypothetical protein
MDEKAGLKAEDAAPLASESVNGSEKEPPPLHRDPPSTASPSSELPADVRAKLRKLEKLESRYQGRLPASHIVIILTFHRTPQVVPDSTCSRRVDRAV